MIVQGQPDQVEKPITPKKYIIIKPEDKMVYPRPSERAVYIKQTLKIFEFEEIGTIEECIFLGCQVKFMSVVKPFGLDTELIFRKCIFYGCVIDSMEIKGEKIKEILGLSFIYCKIKNLELDDIYAPGIYFMDCEINDSIFENSILPGLTFSKFDHEKFGDIIDKVITCDREEAQKVKNEILEYSYRHKHKRESEIRSSKFLFCELNELSISGTNLIETDFKHSKIEYPKILGNVSMHDISLWGTKISEGAFKDCILKDIQIKRGVFFPQLADIFIEIIAAIVFFLSQPSKKRFIRRFLKENSIRILQDDEVDISIWRKVISFKRISKKILYKFRFGGILADWLSSTEIRQTDFDKSDLSEDPFLARQIDEFRIIHSMKQKHPLLAYFFFFTSNYMRSFVRLVFVSLLCICIFTGIYCGSTFTDDIQNSREFGHKFDHIDKCSYPKHPFYLSIEVYLSIPIYPLKARHSTTKVWMIIERILGYGALASFMSILLAPLALAHYKKKKEDEADNPETVNEPGEIKR